MMTWPSVVWMLVGLVLGAAGVGIIVEQCCWDYQREAVVKSKRTKGEDA